MDRLFFSIGSIASALAVGLGAFGAHALRDRLSEDMLAIFETGVRYHFYHALALLALGLAIGRWPEAGQLVTAGWLFVGGILIFSGSLYLLALTGTRWLGAITPIGGVLFILAWGMMALAVYRGG